MRQPEELSLLCGKPGLFEELNCLRSSICRETCSIRYVRNGDVLSLCFIYEEHFPSWGWTIESTNWYNYQNQWGQWWDATIIVSRSPMSLLLGGGPIEEKSSRDLFDMLFFMMFGILRVALLAQFLSNFLTVSMHPTKSLKLFILLFGKAVRCLALSIALSMLWWV